MSTYLQLCQATALDSGTVPGTGSPSSVESQTGRLYRIVTFVANAWRDIQRERQNWRWMSAEFTGTTISGVQAYDAAAMGISSRFGHWIFRGDGDDEDLFSLYGSSQSDEGLLCVIPWERFRRERMIGSAASQTGKPSEVTRNPANELVFYPIPDGAYTVRGRYQKAPQTLAGNTDVPEMPEQFHDLIKWKALMLLGNYDENPNQMPFWGGQYKSILTQLETDQLPRMQMAGPLA